MTDEQTISTSNIEALLRRCFDIAVDTGRAKNCLPPFLPPLDESFYYNPSASAPDEARQLYILAAGKAAGAMAHVAERHYLAKPPPKPGFELNLTGCAVARYGYQSSTKKIEMLQAAHPVPDQASNEAALQALDLVRAARAQDLVLVLLSGGASALWAAPVAGISLQQKQNISRGLLRAGAPIGEINIVRKHLSTIKGGQLAHACKAPMITLAISDVPGDDPSSIGSGPTVADPSTLAQAREILARYKLDQDADVMQALNNDAFETPKPGYLGSSDNSYQLIATGQRALKKAADYLNSRGYQTQILGDALEGEARAVAGEHAAHALELARQARENGQKYALLSGGELTVTVSGDGAGGPNQEYMLALASALKGAPHIYAVAGDTDGSDGGTGQSDDPAGAYITPDTLARAEQLNLTPAIFLENNNSTTFFGALDNLVQTGPTQTNINDFRLILINPEADKK